MGLPKIIQIPCHHVLANQNDLKFRKGAPLKQIFNINLRICIIKKLLVFFVFSTYLPLFLLKFQSGKLVGCRIKLCIKQVPNRHTFDGPHYPKTRNTWKNVMMMSSSRFFQIFLVFGVVGSVKSIPSGYSLDVEFNSISNEIFRSKFG